MKQILNKKGLMGATNPRSIFNEKSIQIKIIVEFYTMK